MKPGRRPKGVESLVTDEQLKEALTACRGIFSRASKWIARNLHVEFSRQGIAKRVRASKTLTEFVNELQEVNVDDAEDKLFTLMDMGNPTAIIFYLKTKGKGRGYCERQEIAAPADGMAPPVIKINFVEAEDGHQVTKE